MTEDTSPENLRKFLESDDPAMVRMGIAMAKGTESPEELYKLIMALSLWDSEEGNREAANELVEEIGIENIIDKEKDTSATDEEIFVEQLISEKNEMAKIGFLYWKALYSQIRDNDSLMKGFWDAIIEGYENGEEITVEIVCALLDDWWNDGGMAKRSHIGHIITRVASEMIYEESISDRILDYAHGSGFNKPNDLALGLILSSEAIDFGPSEQGIRLLQASLDRGPDATDVLSYLDEYDTDTLISLLDDYYHDEDIVKAAIETLGKIADSRAVEPLIKVLGDEEMRVRENAAKALGDIGDERAVEPLIKALSHDHQNADTLTDVYGKQHQQVVRLTAAEALGKIGDERAVEPLIKMLSTTIIKKIAWKDGSLVRIRIGDGRAVAAKEALEKLGHEVDE